MAHSGIYIPAILAAPSRDKRHSGRAPIDVFSKPENPSILKPWNPQYFGIISTQPAAQICKHGSHSADMARNGNGQLGWDGVWMRSKIFL